MLHSMMLDTIEEQTNMKFISDDDDCITFEITRPCGAKYDIDYRIYKDVEKETECARITFCRTGLEKPTTTYTLKTFSNLEIGLAKHAMESMPLGIAHPYERYSEKEHKKAVREFNKFLMKCMQASMQI